MPPEFAPLADSIVDALLAANPSAATFAGDHRFDDRLDDFSADGVAERVTMLRQASDTLAAADVDELVIGEQIDHAILQARVDQELFELTEVREHEWNPLSHNPGALLDALIERPTAPAEVRLASLAARLASIPDALATARATLRNVPQIHLETAAGQFTGTAALVRDGVPRLLAEAPALGGDVKPVAEEAIAALDEFSDWLRAQAAQDVDRPSPRLGRRAVGGQAVAHPGHRAVGDTGDGGGPAPRGRAERADARVRGRDDRRSARRRHGAAGARRMRRAAAGQHNDRRPGHRGTV